MRLPLALLSLAAVTLAARADWPRHPKYGFPVYTNLPAGKQTTGQWAPASTPALSPEDEQKSFRLPAGFEARLFAAEPDVANPVAMTWDERGRLWVLELYEYPLGAKPGEKGRDRVKILEDTDGDGRVDKVTVFADGFSLATGLALGNGGVYVGEAPHLWFLQDTDGDGVADKKTAVLDGFGLEDRHELLNGFTWAPDGQLYFTHGVFTHSKVVNPDAPGEPVVITAGVTRFNPATRRVEVFAEGTSNPWGVDFDARGNAYVSACVIDHFFHLAPGGLYDRQAGQAPYPYAYETLPSIVDHRHHMAAYAGVCVYQGDQWPAAWQGEALMGNIHQNAVNHDHLTVKGSSFSASRRDDFITTSDGWFMPVSSQVGPDGALWVMDWYDKYPCYQNANADPNGVDRERGRIWRIVWGGDQPGKPVPSHPPGMDLAKASSSELVADLAHPNSWRRRMAQHVLSTRSDAVGQKPALMGAAFGPGPLASRLAAFWTLGSAGLLDEAVLDRAAGDADPAVRMWAARFTGDRPLTAPEAGDRLIRLAADPETTVRSAVATACRQHVSGQLTINTPAPAGEDPKIVSRALVALISASKADPDATLRFLIWTAAEPLTAAKPDHALGWLREHGVDTLPLSAEITRKTLRRLCAFRDPAQLDLAVDFLAGLPDDAVRLVSAALDGLLEEQRGRPLAPRASTTALFARLTASSDPGVASKARELGAEWGDEAAGRALIAVAVNDGARAAERVEAIRAARAGRVAGAAESLLGLAGGAAPDDVQTEALRAVADDTRDGTGARILGVWAKLRPAPQRAAAEALASRPAWALALLSSLHDGTVKRGDLPPTVIRTLATHRDEAVRGEAGRVLGRFRPAGNDKLRLIAEKRRVVANGPIDLAAGHDVAKRTCLICHAFHGEGAMVGPDLTGVGRSSLDALLHNVINPNEIIGQGYENVEVETRDGRSFSGRMVENDANHVRLLMAGPQEEVVPKADVKELRVSENSVMPEGLEQMPDQDFRNLIWYILAPPQDGKPLTPERKRELIGGGETGYIPAPAQAPRDDESVALWAPGWEVASAERGGAPAKLPEWGGRRNVLTTHPFDTAVPATIARPVVPPLGRPSSVRFAAASAAGGAWGLRVLADGEVIHREEVRSGPGEWREVRIDLTPYAGRRIVLRLEDTRVGPEPAAAYWSDLRLETGDLAAR